MVRHGRVWSPSPSPQVNAHFLTIPVAGADREVGYWPLAVESPGSSCSAPLFVLGCCGAVLR